MQHLDEGTIHAWLDGELPADEAEKTAVHASECAECEALVAEARGLIAASTRILVTLDDVPAGVAPSGAVTSERPGAFGGAAFRRHWYNRTDLRAAAALLLVAGASLVAVRLGRNPDASFRAITSSTRSPSTVVPLLQDTGEPTLAAAEIAQEDQASKMNAVVGGTSASAEPKRGESAAAASPPARSRKVAARSPAPAFGMASAKDEVSLSKAMGVVRSDAPVPVPVPVPGRVQGQVTDRVVGKGLLAASVIVEGTTLGAITDQQGRFTIDSVPAGVHRLLVRRIGYAPETVPLTITDRLQGATATVALAPSTSKLAEAIVSGVAEATSTSASPLRVLKVDSTKAARRVVYELSPGVEVTLVESLIATGREPMANQQPKETKLDSFSLQRSAAVANTNRAAAPAPMAMAVTKRPQINTISWKDLNRSYSLTGPLTLSELEAIKARLMKMRR